ncbi:hypothetical protein DBZ36_13910 [Alginatibacterium sediminis]|uniref:Polysaccharide chain length determinant N-terminal domain-containing protein n=1 Tax=Alginatibacterium sediminis TaxID=2164068 RepID=A0A420EA19_9ALTE|nr:Wzz/FepE/Etk N-terminal domain-containing protein [Alginatibacterium sediminis]RKF17527.1 hypothetical protein DBZ36_13910 [Alginatibacterium sediminis]
MSKEIQTSNNPPIDYRLMTPSQDDEIDLRELFLAIWKQKWFIMAFSVLFAIGGAIFALKSPNIYESKSELVIAIDPFGLGRDFHESVNEVYLGITSNKVISIVEHQTEQNLSLNFSLDSRNRKILVSKQGTSANDVYKEVKAYTDNINQIFTALKESQLQSTVPSLETTINKQSSQAIQKVLAERYAQQIYKISLLQSPSFELIHLTKEPLQASTHIKPKRALIVVLATLLGVMLSLAIVLVRYAFRKPDAES